MPSWLCRYPVYRKWWAFPHCYLKQEGSNQKQQKSTCTVCSWLWSKPCNGLETLHSVHLEIMAICLTTVTHAICTKVWNIEVVAVNIVLYYTLSPTANACTCIFLAWWKSDWPTSSDVSSIEHSNLNKWKYGNWTANKVATISLYPATCSAVAHLQSTCSTVGKSVDAVYLLYLILAREPWAHMGSY